MFSISVWFSWTNPGSVPPAHAFPAISEKCLSPMPISVSVPSSPRVVKMNDKADHDHGFDVAEFVVRYGAVLVEQIGESPRKRREQRINQPHIA